MKKSGKIILAMIAVLIVLRSVIILIRDYSDKITENPISTTIALEEDTKAVTQSIDSEAEDVSDYVYLNSMEPWECNDFLTRNIQKNELLTSIDENIYRTNNIWTNRSYMMEDEEGIIKYKLRKNYIKLSGVVYVPYASRNADATVNGYRPGYVQIFGDNKLLYEITFDNTMEDTEFLLDIEGVDMLELRMYGGWYKGDGSGLIPLNCVADLKVLEGDKTTPQSAESKAEEVAYYIYLNSMEPWEYNDFIIRNTQKNELLTSIDENTYKANNIWTNRSYMMEDEEGIITYRLRKNYVKLSGVVYVPYASRNANETVNGYRPGYVQIFGDNKLLYEITFDNTMEDTEFLLDIEGVDMLELRMYGGWYKGDGSGLIPLNCVADLKVLERNE